MAESVGDIIDTSKLLVSGIYVEHLCKEVDETEKNLEKFYKRMKRKIESCRSELEECESKLFLSSETRKNIKCLHFDLSASKSEAEKEAILKDIQSELSQIQNLPILETNKEFEDFIKKDYCPIHLSYTSTDDVDYESDFDNDELDIRPQGSDGLSANDQVLGRKQWDDDLPVAKTKHSSSVTESQNATKCQKQSVILSSDEIPDNLLQTETQPMPYEKKTTTITKRLSNYRAAGLHHLTDSAYYRLDNKEEQIFSFPELKHHLADVEQPQQPSQTFKPETDIKILQSGDLELPTCADVKLFETYIITATDENIIKLDRKTNTRMGKLNFQSLGQMCSIRGTSHIGIIQTNSYITIVSTDKELKPVYRIKISKAYRNICHVDTYVNTPRNQPDPSYTFGLVYTDTSGGLYTEKVDLVKAATTSGLQRNPQYNAQVEDFDLRQSKISGISGIGAVWCEKTLNVVLGGVSKIICLEKNKAQIKKKWEIVIRKAATDVVCVKSKLYVCVQDEGRIMLIDINGNIDNENVLEGVLQCKPHKLSVAGESMLIKSFEESRWKNLVFAKQKTANI